MFRFHLQALLICVTLGISISHANELYTSYLPLEKKKLSQKDIRTAFKQVLIKVSGHSRLHKIINLNKYRYKTITSYIVSKSYQQLLENQNYWVIHFDKVQINSILKAHKISVWGQPRPKIHIALMRQAINGKRHLIDKKKIPDEVANAAFFLYLSRGVELEFIRANNNIKHAVAQYGGRNSQNNLSKKQYFSLPALIADKYDAEYSLMLTFRASRPNKSPHKAAHNNGDNKTTVSAYNEAPDTEQLTLLTTPTISNHSFALNSSTKTSTFVLTWDKLEQELYSNHQLIKQRKMNKKERAKKLTHQSLKYVVDFIYARENKATKFDSTHHLVLHKINHLKSYNEVLANLTASRWFKSLKIKGIEETKIRIELSLKGSGDDYFNQLLYQKPILRKITPPTDIDMSLDKEHEIIKLSEEEFNESRDINNIIKKEEIQKIKQKTHVLDDILDAITEKENQLNTIHLEYKKDLIQ